MNEPDEILHMALPDDWDAARPTGEYLVSTRGVSLEQQGFIHCSHPHVHTPMLWLYTQVSYPVRLHTGCPFQETPSCKLYR